MIELENEIRRWREKVERESSLSPPEIDELEDHLRARADLEMELDPTLAPARALAIARDELGQATELSREFAKAGKPRWRRWLSVGLAVFGVSFFLPVLEMASLSPGPSGWIPGWEALLIVLKGWESPFELVSALTNALVLVTLLTLGLSRAPRARWLTGLVAVAAGLNTYWVLLCVLDGINPLVELGIGYWTWLGSFGCLAATLWLRDREWASAKTERVVA